METAKTEDTGGPTNTESLVGIGHIEGLAHTQSPTEADRTERLVEPGGPARIEQLVETGDLENIDDLAETESSVKTESTADTGNLAEPDNLGEAEDHTGACQCHYNTDKLSFPMLAAVRVVSPRMTVPQSDDESVPVSAPRHDSAYVM